MAGTSRYKNQWQQEHCDRINLTVPKGQKEAIQDHAEASGESVNGFINRAIVETIARDQANALRKQQIAEIVSEQGMSVEDAGHIMKLENALALLESEVPGTTERYLSERRRQQLADRSHTPVISIKPSRHNR